MKYFLDTEFLEGPQKKWFGWSKPTIDLISVGIVAEDGREYYAVSKDFNLKAAWKNEWIRDNVLLPIFKEMRNQTLYEPVYFDEYTGSYYGPPEVDKFTISNLFELIHYYGKPNNTIAEEIIKFVDRGKDKTNDFYTYYGDYDWVVFCWLFGRMIDLPKGFPMYSRDLKQMLDDAAEPLSSWDISKLHCPSCTHNLYEYMERSGQLTVDVKVSQVKKHPMYPRQRNEHNALDDARWNKALYEFLKNFPRKKFLKTWN